MTSDADGAATSNDLRRLFEEAVDELGSIAVAHLRINYPAALQAVPKTAQVSLRNAVRSAARARFGALLGSSYATADGAARIEQK